MFIQCLIKVESQQFNNLQDGVSSFRAQEVEFKSQGKDQKVPK